jgi:hypothetical protein
MSFCCRRRFQVRFISSDLWLWLCVLLLVSRLSNGCSTEERTALLEISASLLGTKYFAGMPPSWWLERDHDCCSWEGVECSNDTRRVVSRLQLSSLAGSPPENGLCRTGFNSTAFSAFPELQFLDFSMNYATFQSSDGMNASIYFFYMIALVSFCVANGTHAAGLWFLSYVTNGTHDLPGLAGLSKLRHLDLSYNCLNANDSESLGKLYSLEVLHLEFTGMVGTLPASGDLLQLIMYI